MRKNGVPEKIGKGKGSESTRTDIQIPFLGGRPKRDSTINQDDILNLQIALFTSRTLEEFLSIT